MGHELEIQQWEKYEGDDWWRWAVWIEGENEALDRVDFVEWTLHPTFPNPIRKSTDRANKYILETGGWGTFPIRARAILKDGSEVRLHHELALHYPDGTITSA